MHGRRQKGRQRRRRIITVVVRWSRPAIVGVAGGHQAPDQAGRLVDGVIGTRNRFIAAELGDVSACHALDRYCIQRKVEADSTVAASFPSGSHLAVLKGELPAIEDLTSKVAINLKKSLAFILFLGKICWISGFPFTADPGFVLFSYGSTGIRAVVARMNDRESLARFLNYVHVTASCRRIRINLMRSFYGEKCRLLFENSSIERNQFKIEPNRAT